LWISVRMLLRLSPPVFLSAMLLAEAGRQEARPPAPTETPDSGQTLEAPQPPPGPPEGILPVAEIARIEHGPRERPRVLLQGDALILVTDGGSVELYRAETGEFKWKLGLPGEALQTPVVLAPDPLELLVSTNSGKLLFVDGTTGAITREIALGFEIALAPFVGDGATLYLGTPSGAVVAYDSKSESESFRVETGERPNAFSRAGDTLVVSGAGRSLTAIDAGRGTIRWSLAARAGFSAAATFSDRADRLYVGDDAGEFYCLDAASGGIRFRWSTGAAVRAPALVSGKQVYVVSYGNTLYAYDAGGGSEQWRVNLPGRPVTGPVLVHRRLMVATFDGVLLEVSLDLGTAGERYAAPGELTSAPAFAVASPEVDGSAAGDDSAAPTALPKPQWYEKHRIALALRTGEVLLLAHKAPDPAEADAPEAEEPKKPPPPGSPRARGASPGHLSWKEDAGDPPISLWARHLELEWILHSFDMAVSR
jgi:outer membrane protein assembly factor BamB